jgi:hypothetical protein
MKVSGLTRVCPWSRHVRFGILVQRPALGQRDQQLVQRRLSAVAAQHEIDLWIRQQLLVVVGRRKPAEQHRHVRVHLLRQPGDLDRAVTVRHPVEVDADGLRPQPGKELAHVELRVGQHAQAQVDDAHLHAPLLQVSRDGQEPDGVDLEHDGRRHHVADRAIKDRLLAEVVHARRVQQQQVDGLVRHA